MTQPTPPYTEADVELVTTATEQHYLDGDRTDAMGNNQCACGEWAEGFDGPGWDEHMAEVSLAVLAAAGRLAPAEVKP